MILNNYNLNIKKNFTKKERIYYEIFNKFIISTSLIKI